MRARRTPSPVAAEEYLQGELDSQVRHEFVDGEVYAMVGASDRHGLITLNLGGALSRGLPEHCQVFVSDMKVRIRTAREEIFYYPDVLVSCDPEDRETYYRERPCLIAEVLSPHTARLDRFEKFTFYQHLDGLQEYLLISQDHRQAEVFRRSRQWEATTYDSGDLPLESVALKISLDDIYRRTDR